jgi:release factor glutamine methyltransferase
VTVTAALRDAVERLRAANATETPALDAEVLLGHVTGLGRAQLRAYGERTLAPTEAEAFERLIERRLTREPVAYLTGHREFMGLDFLTDPRALIPRPETELLVEEALKEIRARIEAGRVPLVADIGTGSGAIAVSIAAHEPRLPLVYATDVSPGALALAGENATRIGVAERVRCLWGDLLDSLPERVDVLLANLPYVAPRARTELPADVERYEPAIALYGAEEGLGHIRRFFTQAPEKLRRGATVIVEFGYDQRRAVDTLAHAAFPECGIRFGTDYAGWDRYAVIQTAPHPEV